jgi:peptidyl-prolyl cis-trans isomerase C
MNNKVLALVNGKEITQEIFDFTMSKFPEDRKGHFNTEEGKKELLDQIISWELVYNHGKALGIENTEAYLFQIEEAKKAIMGQLIIQDVLSNILIDDNEVVEYYNQNKEFFNEQEQVSAKHILVETEEKANKVLELINNGLAFETAAKEYSSCPSKDQGGNLGEFGRGMMVPEFEEAAFSSKIGVVTHPVKTQFGYHLILVEEKIEPKAKAFEEVRESIKGHLLQEKQNHAYVEFVNSLKDKYKVVIK